MFLLLVSKFVACKLSNFRCRRLLTICTLEKPRTLGVGKTSSQPRAFFFRNNYESATFLVISLIFQTITNSFAITVKTLRQEESPPSPPEKVLFLRSSGIWKSGQNFWSNIRTFLLRFNCFELIWDFDFWGFPENFQIIHGSLGLESGLRYGQTQFLRLINDGTVNGIVLFSVYVDRFVVSLTF